MPRLNKMAKSLFLKKFNLASNTHNHLIRQVSHFEDIKFHKELITDPKKLAKIQKGTKL